MRWSKELMHPQRGNISTNSNMHYASDSLKSTRNRMLRPVADRVRCFYWKVRNNDHKGFLNPFDNTKLSFHYSLCFIILDIQDSQYLTINNIRSVYAILQRNYNFNVISTMLVRANVSLELIYLIMILFPTMTSVINAFGNTLGTLLNAVPRRFQEEKRQ